ncbi:MarR family winged helix-turn-helix transcriptional regulator [Desulfovibrio gilichinskyi]|uniref:DNA-binding transcriptional regulator, MarR family n=1 Tax=Desulfovibrio gilichinskyi TaxID=1519643 RepID=A0A1X7EEW8_9BACT|nr:MarR family transcriptional regulator [Desulfovibrio gilichinskyi]SMF32762.1 DNA-binding transcriptional regulator, MarR family [Desulfovibrio gilichinskyi]
MHENMSLGYLNTQITRLHRAIVEDKLSALGITYCQVGFVMTALNHPGWNQEQLSHFLVVDKGSTARSVAKLIKLKFLYREENPQNRREKLVYPTEKAEEIREDLHKALQSANQLMMSNLREPEKVVLLEMMKRMIDTGRNSLGMSSIWQNF